MTDCPPGKKICTKCKEPIDIEDFHRNKRCTGGRVSICKWCRRKTRKDYYAKRIKPEMKRDTPAAAEKPKDCCVDSTAYWRGSSHKPPGLKKIKVPCILCGKMEQIFVFEKSSRRYQITCAACKVSGPTTVRHPGVRPKKEVLDRGDKLCVFCRKPLVQKPNERDARFASRESCNKKCAGLFRKMKKDNK